MFLELPERCGRLLRAGRWCENSFSHPARRAVVVGAIAWSLALAWPCGAKAQSRALSRQGSIAFADFTPESAGLFIGVRRLGDLDAALNRAHAWQLLMIVSGGSLERARSLELPKALAGLLGFRGTMNPATLADSEVGLALPPSMDLRSAVWFMRLSDRGLLDRWFPPAARLESGATGFVRHFQLRNRSKVAVSGNVVALSRQWGPGSFFEKTVSVMSGRGGSLARSAEFRDVSAYMPEKYLAVSYLAGAQAADGSVTPPLSWWPVARQVMIGLFERDGRIDVAISASLARRGRRAKLSRTAIDRLHRLPQTTLLAAAISIDIAHLRGAKSDAKPPGLLARYLAFLSGLQDPSPAPDAARPQLGPHVLIAWGQDLREDGSTPQVALMVECADGKAVRRHSRNTVDGLLKFLTVLEPELIDVAPTIVRSRHLGATIFSVSFAAYADKSALPFMQVVRDASPAWTVWNGWLILAVSRDHVERILDAQYGLIPGLITVDDVRGLRLNSADRSVVSIVQPDLATKVLDGWLAAHEKGMPSLLDASWWGGKASVDPADALRELAAVGRTLEFGSYAVDTSDPEHFSARVSLRFRAPRVSEAKPE